ncbi:hypothetical protein J5N97_022407 [Dioscorea zingiberensis]|uniref:Amidophosphoribosyltransferase n=1 Tax=Dioscorea zingiberensis TaxID=325984 RepID=A0A9D5CB55_9LILI|nr:hypothetical protein J5N97_022407 [Dioscorea zingiberensis]
MAACTSSVAAILFTSCNPNPKPKFPHHSKPSSYPHLHLRRHNSFPVSATTAATGGALPETEEIDFDREKPREECGVVGILGHPDAAQLCSLALHALQHRGQEGAGIAASDLSSIRSATGLGLVSEVLGQSRSPLSLPGSAAIGHVRYSTAGAASALHNVQPFLASCRFGQLAVAHNGNLVNYPSLRASLEDQGSIFSTTSDTEAILHLIATSKSGPFLSRVAEACSAIRGAYSLLFLTVDKLLAVRDPYGFRPLVLGRLSRDNGAQPAVVFASETCALDLIGAKYEREVEPGEAVIVDARTLEISSACLMPSKPRKACVFELIYFALPQSIVFGRPVHEARHSFGATLAAESPAPGADVVIPVPDSGFFAALGFAKLSGLPFQQGLIRSHYVGRTFIQPSQEIRDLGVKLKLSPVRGILEGKSVVVVDDSIVRGTTSKKIVNLLRDAGAREVHMRIASPPIIGSCYYGVDTARPEELVSNRLDIEGVRKEIGADSLAFLSLDSLKGLLGDEAPTFCDACFTRDYPVHPGELVEAKSKEPLYIN